MDHQTLSWLLIPSGSSTMGDRWKSHWPVVKVILIWDEPCHWLGRTTQVTGRWTCRGWIEAVLEVFSYFTFLLWPQKGRSPGRDNLHTNTHTHTFNITLLKISIKTKDCFWYMENIKWDLFSPTLASSELISGNGSDGKAWIHQSFLQPHFNIYYTFYLFIYPAIFIIFKICLMYIWIKQHFLSTSKWCMFVGLSSER